MVDLATDTTAWKVELDDASAWAGSPLFTDDGEHVVAGVFWDPYNRDRIPSLERGGTIENPPPDVVGIRMWDADTGELVEQYDVGRCGGYVAATSATHLLVRTLRGSASAVAACDWAQGTIGTELVDRRSGERRLLAENSPHPLWGAAMSGDGTTVAYDDIQDQHQVVVADTSTGEPLLRFTPATEQARWGVRALNDDGSLLLYGDQPIQVWDVAAGEQVASFDGHQGGSLFATFSPSARTVLSTGTDGTLREWDAATGDEIRTYPGIGEGRVAATPDGLVLVIAASGSNAAPASLIDTRARGELGAVETCPGFVAADSLRVAGGLAVFHTTCDGDRSGTTYVVDVQAGRLLYTLPGHQAQALGVSADGTRFVRQEGEGTMHGPLAVRDLRTGAEIVELEGLCTWDAASPLPPEQQEGCAAYPDQPFGISAWRLKWSPDGTMIAAAADTTVVVWDADTGALLYAEDPDPARLGIADVIFSPDSQLLIATSNDAKDRLISTRTWEVLTTHTNTGSSVGLVGFTPDGTKLLAANQLMANTGGSLHWFDVAAEQLALSKNDIHEGSLRSVALSPDGALVATAASDGLVRVWDGATLELVHEVPLGDSQIQGVAFVDDHHLAVTPQEGNLLLVTIDPDELLDIVRRSLTRGFTATECTRFGFGDECPTLAELRGRPDGAGDPAVLNGSYEVRWTAAAVRYRARRRRRAEDSRRPGDAPTAIPAPTPSPSTTAGSTSPTAEPGPSAPAATPSPATGCASSPNDATPRCDGALAARMPPRPVPRRHVRAHRRRAGVQRHHRPPSRRRSLRRPAPRTRRGMRRSRNRPSDPREGDDERAANLSPHARERLRADQQLHRHRRRAAPSADTVSCSPPRRRGPESWRRSASSRTS